MSFSIKQPSNSFLFTSVNRLSNQKSYWLPSTQNDFDKGGRKRTILSVTDNTTNGDVNVSNNLIINGSTTYPDGSISISNTLPLMYPSSNNNNLTFKKNKNLQTSDNPPTQTGISPGFKSISISSSGQYQTFVSNLTGGLASSICISNNYGVDWRQSRFNFVSPSHIIFKSVSVSGSGQYQTVVAETSDSKSDLIYKSDDYGESWQALSADQLKYARWSSVTVSSSGRYQTAVSYSDSEYNTANGVIYISSDYGNTWNVSKLDLNASWFSVSMSSSGQYQTISGSDIETEEPIAILYSNDYGVTWNQSDLIFIGIITVSSSGQYQTVVGKYNNNQIWYSDDYGLSWYKSEAPELDYWSITMSSSGQFQYTVAKGLISELSNKILYSSNYGENWYSLDNTNIEDLRAISISSSGQFITVLSNTEIYTSSIPFSSEIVTFGNFYTPQTVPTSLPLTTFSPKPLFNYTFSGEILNINGYLNIGLMPDVNPQGGVFTLIFDIPTGFKLIPFDYELLTIEGIATGSIVSSVSTSPFTCVGKASYTGIVELKVSIDFIQGPSDLTGMNCDLSFNASFKAKKL
jgi:photosystem II stability/assembly factor-like uncharacterized protein